MIPVTLSSFSEKKHVPDSKKFARFKK